MTRHQSIHLFRFLGLAVLFVLALATLGTFVPEIPLLGEVGPILIARFGPWITVVSLVGACICLRRWRTNRRRRTLLLAGLAAFAAIGTLWVQTRQVAVARANGVQVRVSQAFLAGPQADDSLQPVTVDYAEHDGKGLPLDIYRSSENRSKSLATVFVYIHGGGWGAETLRQRKADLRWLSERGFVAVSLECALSAEGRPTWNIAEPQLACALAWLGRNVARFGGAPSRLALWGESAGGNLALNLSYRANAGKLATTCKRKIPRIAAIVALYPVVDPERMYHNPDPLIGRFGRTMTTRYTGGTPGHFPERYRAIASATHISAKAPPTLLIVPEADHLVLPDTAYAFESKAKAKAKAAGVETRLITMPYAEHSFDLRSVSIGNQMVRKVMLRFLQEHGLKP